MWLRRLGVAIRWRRFDRELSEELRLHREARERALVDEGLSPRDARDRARREIGSTLHWQERSADVWRFAPIDALMQDVRGGLRPLRRGPALAVSAILTIALAIGLLTSIFSIVRALLLSPLRSPTPRAWSCP